MTAWTAVLLCKNLQINTKAFHSWELSEERRLLFGMTTWSNRSSSVDFVHNLNWGPNPNLWLEISPSSKPLLSNWFLQHFSVGIPLLRLIIWASAGNHRAGKHTLGIGWWLFHSSSLIWIRLWADYIISLLPNSLDKKFIRISPKWSLSTVI